MPRRGDAAGDILRGIENLIGSAYLGLLYGDAGNNTLTGGATADALIGGAGLDTANYSTSASGVTVDLATGTASGGDAAGDAFSSIENMNGSAHADTLTGNAGSNALTGGTGNDRLGASTGTTRYGAEQEPIASWAGSASIRRATAAAPPA